MEAKNQETMCCSDCQCFSGLNPSFTEGAPMAFCAPEGASFAKPCEPYEVADCKPCFVPPKKGS